MHTILMFSFPISILNVINAKGICGTRVTANGNLCFAPFLVKFTREM